MDTIEVTCPACRPRPAVEEVCDNCKQVLNRGICMTIFHIMEAGFGAAIGVSAATGNYVAMAVFAFAAFVSVFLVVKLW